MNDLSAPVVGELRKGRDIGKTTASQLSQAYVFSECEGCGEAHWVKYCVSTSVARFKRCRRCATGFRYVVRSRPLPDVLAGPRLGDEVYGRDLGCPLSQASRIFVWKNCLRCGGNPRWVIRSRERLLCKSCVSIQASPNARARTKGVRTKTKSNGYVMVFVYPDNPYFAMASTSGIKAGNGTGGYISEHRLVMAQHLGRCLESWEIIHHKNSIKDDNRLENLELLPNQASHRPSTEVQRQLSSMRAKIVELELMLLLKDLQIRELEHRTRGLVKLDDSIQQAKGKRREQLEKQRERLRRKLE